MYGLGQGRPSGLPSYGDPDHHHGLPSARRVNRSVGHELESLRTCEIMGCRGPVMGT